VAEDIQKKSTGQCIVGAGLWAIRSIYCGEAGGRVSSVGRGRAVGKGAFASAPKPKDTRGDESGKQPLDGEVKGLHASKCWSRNRVWKKRCVKRGRQANEGLCKLTVRKGG